MPNGFDQMEHGHPCVPRWMFFQSSPPCAQRESARHYISVYRKSGFENLNSISRRCRGERLQQTSATQVTRCHIAPAEFAEAAFGKLAVIDVPRGSRSGSFRHNASPVRLVGFPQKFDACLAPTCRQSPMRRDLRMENTAIDVYF